jgi:Tfp pilus assembly protein PilO
MALKSREKIMIGVAVLIGVVMGFDQFLTQPKKKEALTLQKQIQEFNEKLASVTVSVSGLNQLKKRVEEKRKEKEALAGRIPDDRQLNMILDRLGKESQAKKIDLIQMNFSEKAAGDPKEGKGGLRPGSFRKVTLDVDLASEFGAIGPCLESLSSLPIFLEIEKVDIRRKEEIFPKLLVTIQQNLYISSTPNQPGARP